MDFCAHVLNLPIWAWALIGFCIPTWFTEIPMSEREQRRIARNVAAAHAKEIAEAEAKEASRRATR